MQQAQPGGLLLRDPAEGIMRPSDPMPATVTDRSGRRPIIRPARKPACIEASG